MPPENRAVARHLGRELGLELAASQEKLRAWQDRAQEGHRLPEGTAGVAYVRMLAQWVLDFAADGCDYGFPFDRPYLAFYKRGCQMLRAVDAYHRQPPDDRIASRALRRLGRILGPLRSDQRFAPVARVLSGRIELFEMLRSTLRLTPKPSDKESTRAPSTQPFEEASVDLRDLQQEVGELEEWLKKNRPERGPAEDRRQAIDLILRHLEVHGPSLWGHAIALSHPTSNSDMLRLVDRTNNVDESWFHGLKHDERRRSGRKILTQDLEQLPAAAALARNLRQPDYVTLLCGSLENLPLVFAELDRSPRTPAPQTEAPRQSLLSAPGDAPVDVLSASLTKADRKLVRSPALEARILAAAKSRAPTVDFKSRATSATVD